MSALLQRPRRPAQLQRGQSLVEFALIAPLMVVLIVAIFDLSRIYTTMVSVESAAREAADFATSLGADHWLDTAKDETIAKMQRRACVAASDLPDFAWTDSDADGIVDQGEQCTNPTFDWCMSESTGGTCLKPDFTDPAYTCSDKDRDPPCTVTVTMSHVFHLFVPLQFDFFGVQIGLPTTLAFERDSTFAMTDIDVEETPAP